MAISGRQSDAGRWWLLIACIALVCVLAPLRLGAAEPQPLVVGQVRLDVPDDVQDRTFLEAVDKLRERLPIKPGERYEPDMIQDTIRILYRHGLFAQITAYTRQTGGSVDLRFLLRPITAVMSIDFEGNDTLDSDQLKRAIHLRQGDSVFSENLDKAKRQLLRFYLENGFPDAKIYIERQSTKTPYANVIRFIIAEGEPLLIDRIDFVGDPYFSRRKLLKRLEVKHGDRLVVPEIFKAIRNLSDYYREQGFKEARLELVEGGDDANVRQSPMYRKGRVRIRIEAGRKVSLRFVGNRRYSPSELTKALKLDDQQILAYSWATLQKLSANLQRFYLREGYLHAHISTGAALVGERKKVVTFLIQEGKRVKLTDVVFKGNDDIAAKKLERELFAFVRGRLATETDDALTPPDKGGFSLGSGSGEGLAPGRTGWAPWAYRRPERLDADEVYIPALFEEASHALELYYRENGYLECKIGPPRLQFNSTGERLVLTYSILEGVQTRIRSIRISGANVKPVEDILDIIGMKIRDPLNDLAFEPAINNIKVAYADMGYIYANAKLSFALTRSRRWADVTIRIVEGPQVKVGQILVRGLEKTRQGVVLRELTFGEGDVYTPQQMEDSQRWLQRLGIFQAVTLKPWNPEKMEPVKDVEVRLMERPPGRFEVGGGVATDDGIRVRTAFIYRNLFGSALEFHFRAQANYRIPAFLDNQFATLYRDLTFGEALEREIGVGLFYPSMNGSHISVRSDLIHQRVQQRSYGMDKNSFIFGFGTELLHYFTISQINEFSYLDVRETQLSAISPTEEAQKPTSGQRWEYSPKLQGIFDYRDSMFDPTRGVTISFLFEYFETITGTFNTDLFRTSAGVSGYIPIPVAARPWVLRLTARGGYIRLFNGEETPVEKRFKLGGRGSIRGFGEEAVYPAEVTGGTTVLEPSRGGDTFLLMKADLRIPVYKSYYVGAFTDWGQLWIDPSHFDFKLGDYKKSAGFGAHYRTPVGDISLEIGWNLDPDERLKEESWRLHFSISLF